MWFDMNRKIRWELVFFDSLVFLFSALMIFVFYPSSISHLTRDKIILYTVIGWALVTGSRLFFKIYQKIWRYAGPTDYINLIIADLVATGVIVILRELLVKEVTFMRAFSLVALNLLGCIMIRLIYQCVYINRGKDSKLEKSALKLLKIFTGTRFEGEKVSTNKIKVAIVGAGSVGTMLAEELIQNPKATYEPVCFVDVDKQKAGRMAYGVPVISSADINETNAGDKEKEEYRNGLKQKLDGFGVQEVVFALPNMSTERRKDLYQLYRDMGYKIKAYDAPTFGERGHLHDFKIEDLLFRSAQDFLTEETRAYYRGKSVLITGGGGSIGSELARQIAKCEPKRLVLLDVYENGAYDVQQELKRKYPNLNLRVEIASICDREGLEKIFSDHTPDIVLHAAAHKHVPLMERNVIEAVRNNVFGTKNVVDCCEQFGVKRFIMISTDKAVNPTNVMGATKRMCEMIVLSRAKTGKTKYSATRFGNVLGSNGSVIPLFQRQIDEGGPVTITDRNIIRYFMTIPEASQLVMTSGAMADNGELFVLDMGDPVKILDLAEMMIRMNGFEPGVDMEIKEVGLRPGEKMYEELLVKGENLGKTENEKIFTEKDAALSAKEIDEKLNVLKRALESKSNREVKAALKSVVPTYHDPEEVNGVAGETA